MQDGLQDDEKIHLQQKEQEIKEQEEKMQMLHKDLQEQSKEILQMKQELQKVCINLINIDKLSNCGSPAKHLG